MDLEKKIGLRVKVVKLGDTKGMLVRQHYLDARKVGATGTIIGFFPGHGGDLLGVKHDKDSQIGAYTLDELKKI